jgi:hypothetical protein
VPALPAPFADHISVGRADTPAPQKETLDDDERHPLC